MNTKKTSPLYPAPHREAVVVYCSTLPYTARHGAEVDQLTDIAVVEVRIAAVGPGSRPRGAGADGRAPVSVPRPARVVDAEAGPRVPKSAWIERLVSIAGAGEDPASFGPTRYRPRQEDLNRFVLEANLKIS